MESCDACPAWFATELVFLLERFAQRCLPVALDQGDRDEDARYKANYFIPELSYALVSGDWHSLPADLLYQLQQLEVLREESVSIVNSAFIESSPYDNDGIIELNNQASSLGIRSIHLPRQLRRLCSMSADRLEDRKWSLWSQLCIAAGQSIEQGLRYAQSKAKLQVALAQIPSSHD